MNERKRGVVDHDALATAMHEQTQAPDYEILASEPLLSAYVSHELHSIIGKLALVGCPHEALHLLDKDLRQITGTAARAVQQGYRTFMKEFMPADDHCDDSPGASLPNENPSADGGDWLPF